VGCGTPRAPGSQSFDPTARTECRALPRPAGGPSSQARQGGLAACGTGPCESFWSASPVGMRSTEPSIRVREHARMEEALVNSDSSLNTTSLRSRVEPADGIDAFSETQHRERALAGGRALNCDSTPNGLLNGFSRRSSSFGVQSFKSD